MQTLILWIDDKLLNQLNLKIKFNNNHLCWL